MMKISGLGKQGDAASIDSLRGDESAAIRTSRRSDSCAYNHGEHVVQSFSGLL